MITRLGKTLRHVRSAFEELGLRWFLFGAQAVIAYGVVRSTLDIDVTVDAGDLANATIVDALVRQGFRPTENDPAFVATSRVLPFEHRNGIPVDLVLSGPGFDGPIFDRAVRRKLGGVFVPVATAEDIVVMKVMAQRGKDLLDLQHLLFVNQHIAIDRVRETLGHLEADLGQSDLLPVFEAALKEARRPRGLKR